VTRESAQAELEAVTRQVDREHAEDSNHGALVKPLHEWIVGDVRRAFLTLLGAVGFVLLICCANIANLLMARATARQAEMAIRASLGAGRFRLVRQTLVESVLLALIGGTLGVPLAVGLVRAVPTVHAFYIPRAQEIVVDYKMLVVVIAISLASGIIFGLAPALQIAHQELGRALQRGSASAGLPAGGLHLLNMLVVAQLALALVLLSGAGLMTNSLLRPLNIDLGFERANVITISTSIPYKRYDRNRRADFHRRLMTEVSRLPGVHQVSASDHLPLQAVLFPYQLNAEGSGLKCEAMARDVAPNYLSVMGIRLFAGRDFEPADDNRKPVPALINQKAARTLFGADDPIGKHLATNYKSRKVLQVVGVVGDAHQLGLREDPGPQLYLPLAYGYAQYVLARAATNVGDLGPAVRVVAHSIDPEVPTPEVSTMDAEFSREVAKPSFYLLLLGTFSVVGVILAAVGIYGVMSYTVARRTHEIGLRMALGAGQPEILHLVLQQGIRLTLAGVGIGLAVALSLARILSSMLYRVSATDPATFLTVVLFLAVIAVLACYIPARRATRVDPMVALRHE
jgi:putative ABC transport system permease protein